LKITFLGAVETVTGSKYLLESSSKKILVDCGLFQGHKELRSKNWSKLPFEPSNIDAVILTHAHIDHTGYIPLLVKNGFKGKIYCSDGTFALCKILLPDSGFLQEEEAQFANKYGYSKHTPAMPLYTAEDAKISLEQFQPCDFEKINTFFDKNITFQFRAAGHILGASTVYIKMNDISVTFSGDVGRMQDPIMRPPKPIPYTDYLVLESTYGNRLHHKMDPQSQLKAIINRTVKRGGTIVIPAFAVGRAQSILYYIHELKTNKQIPDIPVFLDSPMAISVTDLFCQFMQEHRLTKNKCEYLNSVAIYTNSVAESKKIDTIQGSKIIISASGMATGGRVLHHINVFGPDEKSTIIFTGFQAAGTRGERMLKGEKEIRLLGETVKINAEVTELHNTSAHADYEELLEWLKRVPKAPKKVFLTHGEPDAALALKKYIEEKLHWTCVIPKYLQEEVL